MAVAKIPCITIGVYIFNPSQELLVLRPSETSYDIWGIPKGRPEEDEIIKFTGVREVYEETGIDLLPHYGMLKYVGAMDYVHKQKTLVAFTVSLPYYIPIEDLRCSSTFISRTSKKDIPEVDKYQWVMFDDFKDKVQQEQVKLWEKYRCYEINRK